eukprot:jgi/Ulvmu1/3508/UM162_0015.1
MELLTASLGVTLPEVTKKRHIARLERESGAAVDQTQVNEAAHTLADKAPSAERFRACCDDLAAHPGERDALLVLLWKLAQHTNQMETSPGKRENVASSANVQRPTVKIAQPADRKPDNPTDHRYAEHDQSSFLDSSFMDVSNSMELHSPLESVPGGHYTPAARRRSPLADSSPIYRMNPMFSEMREDVGGSPIAATQPTNSAMQQEMEFVPTAAVTLPDAGNLFQPIQQVIAESSPEHMRHRAAELCLSTIFLNRPYLTGDWVLTAAHEAAQPDGNVQTLEGTSAAQQEVLLVEDLLNAFMGVATNYLELVPMTGPSGQLHIVYSVSRQHGQHCDASLCEQVQRLLHIPESVLLISRFVETRLACEFGSVCNAFAEAVRARLDAWEAFVCGLETKLSASDQRLAMLTYYCDSIVPSIHLIATVCAEASAAAAAGADLLNLLHARARTVVGSARSAKLLQDLLAAAAAPYFEVLTRWVAAGALADPFAEFMVVAVPGMRTDAELHGESAFWAGGHQLRLRPAAADGGDGDVPDMPAFLADVQDEVLKAGKHWSILRQCQEHGAGATGAMDGAENIDKDSAVAYDPKGIYLQAIRTHYQRAGTALLNMMLAHFDLRQWLGTCKNFFLLAQSDFLTNFLDSAGEELAKEAGRTSVARLRSLLEIAIRTSSLHRSPHADQLLLTLDSRSFSELHTNLFKSASRKSRATKNVSKIKSAELLMLQLSIQWPLSIVLSPRSMRMYQFCFRHLLNCKGVEGNLGETWKQLSRARMLRFRKPEERGAQRTLMRVLLLINRMLVFVQRYLHFVTVEVIDPQWHMMMTKIKDAASIDEVIELHSRCLLSVMRFGLMERLKALSMVAIITWTSRDACSKIMASLGRVKDAERRTEVTADMLLTVVSAPDFVENIDRSERDFTEGVEKLHAELKAHKYAVQSGTSDDRQVEADMIQNFIDQIPIKHFSPAGHVMREAVRHLARH